MDHDLKRRAREAMPGGVNSPVRAFAAVGGEPIFAARGRGARLETVDGRGLIDFCMSFGPLLLGHAPPEVTRAVAAAAGDGTSFAVTTAAEIEMAELIKSALPGAERVRMVSSGTEACMTAIRLARGATGRSRVLKFSGCYHGHADGLLVRAGSGVAGSAEASSAGVPGACAALTLVARYNALEDVHRLVAEFGADLAAIVVEPVAANIGLVPPAAGFLEGLAEAARSCGALLVFDEVITGFRLTFGGYQNLCGVRPDLTTLGKVIGGGLPVGALAGPARLMEQLAPLGPVYQAGTLSGNPVCMAAGLAALRRLRAEPPYADLAARTERFCARLEASARRAGVAVQIPRLGSLFSLFFAERPPRSFEEVLDCDREAFARLFTGLLENGVYLPPSPFETCFLSTAHDEATLAEAAAAFDRAFARLR